MQAGHSAVFMQSERNSPRMTAGPFHQLFCALTEGLPGWRSSASGRVEGRNKQLRIILMSSGSVRLRFGPVHVERDPGLLLNVETQPGLHSPFNTSNRSKARRQSCPVRCHPNAPLKLPSGWDGRLHVGSEHLDWKLRTAQEPRTCQQTRT